MCGFGEGKQNGTGQYVVKERKISARGEKEEIKINRGESK